jgi:hypothetical protein
MGHIVEERQHVCGSAAFNLPPGDAKQNLRHDRDQCDVLQMS